MPHFPMQFSNMARSRTVTTHCFSEDRWPLTIFLKDRQIGVSGQDLSTFRIRMYVATTESHYCTEDKGSKKATGTVPRRFSDHKCQSVRRAGVLSGTTAGNTLLSTFRFCAHLLHRSNMQNECLLCWVIVIFFFLISPVLKNILQDCKKNTLKE